MLQACSSTAKTLQSEKALDVSNPPRPDHHLPCTTDYKSSSQVLGSEEHENKIQTDTNSYTDRIEAGTEWWMIQQAIAFPR